MIRERTARLSKLSMSKIHISVVVLEIESKLTYQIDGSKLLWAARIYR